MITSEDTRFTNSAIVPGGRGPTLREEDALATLTLRVRSLLMWDPVTEGAHRQSLMTAAYGISLALEWIDVRVRHEGYTTELESELLVIALEVSVLEQEWFCGDH
jgi:hypothetical protein